MCRTSGDKSIHGSRTQTGHRSLPCCCINTRFLGPAVPRSQQHKYRHRPMYRVRYRWIGTHRFTDADGYRCFGLTDTFRYIMDRCLRLTDTSDIYRQKYICCVEHYQKPLFSITLVFCFSVLQMRGVLGIQTEQHASHAFSDQPPSRIFASIFAPPVCGAWPPSEPAKEEGSARRSRETVQLLAEVLRRPHLAQDRCYDRSSGRWLVVTIWDYDCQPPDGCGHQGCQITVITTILARNLP